jgi:hypothetical protein
VPDPERATALIGSVATPYEEAMTMSLRRSAKKFRFLKVLCILTKIEPGWGLCNGVR